jgi:curved DNA-binding protein CbpA
MIQKEDPEIAYERALKFMGLKRNSTPIEITKRWRLLSHKYHPDLHPGLGETKMQQLNEAYTILESRRERPQYTKKDIAPILNKIRSQQQTYDDNELQDITSKLIIASKDNKDEVDKIHAAYNVMTHELDNLEYLRRKQHSRLKRTIRRTLMTPEQRMGEEFEQEKNKLFLKGSVRITMDRLKHLSHNIFKTKGKHYIKIKTKHHKKPSHIKYIALTASIITAIIGGKYLYNHIHKSYTKKSTTYLPKEVKR